MAEWKLEKLLFFIGFVPVITSSVAPILCVEDSLCWLHVDGLKLFSGRVLLSCFSMKHITERTPPLIEPL